MDDLWRTWKAGSLTDMQTAWSARDVSCGHRVQLVPEGPEGIAAGIDPTGALRVRLPDGREAFARAGELLFLGSTASQP
jgi:biotin-(acetyl-CoA carboxylase) ligase